MIEGLLYQKLVSGMSTPTVTERLVNSILLEGHLRKQMEQLLDRLATAQERVCRRLESIGFEIFCEPRAGMFVWARPAGWEGDAGELATRALGERIVLAPGKLFYGGNATTSWMRFNVVHSHFDQLYASEEGNRADRHGPIKLVIKAIQKVVQDGAGLSFIRFKRLDNDNSGEGEGGMHDEETTVSGSACRSLRQD